MDNLAFCTEMKEFMEKLFSETDQQLNLILEEGTKDLESYLDAAAEKFKKRRKLKKPSAATEVDNEQNPLHSNQKENEPEFKRPTRTASKVACQKLKNDAQMTAKKKLRCVTDKEGNYVIHSNESAVLPNIIIKQERISEESDNCVEFGATEFDNTESTRNILRAIDEIVQSPSASSQIPYTSSLESNIEQKPTILNGTVVLSDKSSKLDLGLNVEHQSNGSDKESKSVKSSKRTTTKAKKTTDQSTDSSSSSALSTVGSPQPMRVTRTKTRALANAATLYSDLELCKENISSAKKCKNSTLPQSKNINNGSFHNTHKEITTINKNSKLPLALNNTCTANWSRTQNNGNQPSKVGMIVSHLESFITKPKPQQVPLATKQLEDAQMREEKAAEAEKKKERLLKEKVENQKRINEAKQLKVHKAREQMELQKQEKLRQLQLKKAETLKKQKELEQADLKARLQEHHHKKELGFAKAAAEQEARDEKSQLEKGKPVVVMQKVQADLNVTYDASSGEAAKPFKSNVFSVNDIYSGESSEEEEERISKKIFPKWTLPEYRKRALRIQSTLPFETIQELIVCGEQTPDLTMIFENIPKRALTRTSSAVWNTPPIHSFK